MINNVAPHLKRVGRFTKKRMVKVYIILINLLILRTGLWFRQIQKSIGDLWKEDCTKCAQKLYLIKFTKLAFII